MGVAQKIDVDLCKPYLLVEVKPMKFYVVKRIQISRSDSFKFIYEGEDEDVGIKYFKVNDHIREVPNHGIELMVECSENESVNARAFHVLRLQALRDGYDFVSFQPYHGDQLVEIVNEQKGYVGKVMPRLFNEIPIDDLPSQN
jgi:hypothetical protein